MSSLREVFGREKAEAIVVQSHWRRLESQHELELRRQVVEVQSLYRMWAARDSYQVDKSTVTKVQALYRMTTLRGEWKLVILNAAKVQSLARMSSLRKEFGRDKTQTTVLQSHWR